MKQSKQQKKIETTEPEDKVEQVDESIKCTCGGCCKVTGSAGDTEYSGVTDDGKPYTHICRQYVKCDTCGNCRIERQHVYKE